MHLCERLVPQITRRRDAFISVTKHGYFTAHVRVNIMSQIIKAIAVTHVGKHGVFCIDHVYRQGDRPAHRIFNIIKRFNYSDTKSFVLYHIYSSFSEKHENAPENTSALRSPENTLRTGEKLCSLS